MKKLIITIILIGCINTIKAQSVKDSILNINLVQYIDKPMDSLISRLPYSYDSMFTRSSSSMFVGAKIIICYSNPNLWIYIYPGSHNYYTPINAAHNPPHIAWPLASVRKEKIWRIVVLDTSDFPLRDICCGTD